MSQGEIQLRTILKEKFGISTSKCNNATRQDEDVFVVETPPIFHCQDGKKRNIVDFETPLCDISGWATACLYSKEEKGVSLCADAFMGPSEIAAEGTHKMKARKYRASELLLRLCDICGYKDVDGVVWRQEQNKRPSRRRLCGEANCCNPFHRELNCIEEKRGRFLKRLQLHALQCQSVGIVDQGTLNDEGRSKKCDKTDTPRPSTTEPGAAAGSKRCRESSNHIISCGHPHFVGWIDNVKVWISDKNNGCDKVCVILDFVARVCIGNDTAKRYHAVKGTGDVVDIHVHMCSSSKDANSTGLFPVSIETSMAVDVQYIDHESDIYTLSVCHTVSKIDFEGTLRACGGRDAFLQRLKRDCLEQQIIDARVVPALPTL